VQCTYPPKACHHGIDGLGSAALQTVITASVGPALSMPSFWAHSVAFQSNNGIPSFSTITQPGDRWLS
jgi:hypothetical protein